MLCGRKNDDWVSMKKYWNTMFFVEPSLTFFLTTRRHINYVCMVFEQNAHCSNKFWFQIFHISILYECFSNFFLTKLCSVISTFANYLRIFASDCFFVIQLHYQCLCSIYLQFINKHMNMVRTPQLLPRVLILLLFNWVID